MWQYHNPVRIRFGAGVFDELADLIAGRSYALVTYPEPAFAALARRLAGRAGAPLLTIDDIAPNPDIATLDRQAARLAGSQAQPQVFVALGGGSVIDSAKVLAAASRIGFAGMRAWLETGAGSFAAAPIIAVPTTAGTGSEVTSWGTVWNAEKQAKHSLAHPLLYPEAALVDPVLMLGKPRGLTVSTGLDALSHALESLWNRNANPVSANHAVAAAREIVAVLPALAADLGNADLRERMARAALFAGLAFSNTKTAIAHSLSYPITLRHGVPHGIACSFTLPMILESLDGQDFFGAEALRRIFDADLPAGAMKLGAFLASLGVSTDPQSHGVTAGEWSDLVNTALEGERGRNFIGSAAALSAAARL